MPNLSELWPVVLLCLLMYYGAALEMKQRDYYSAVRCMFVVFLGLSFIIGITNQPLIGTWFAVLLLPINLTAAMIFCAMIMRNMPQPKRS